MSTSVGEASISDMPETLLLNFSKADIPLFKLQGEHQVLEEEFVEMGGYTHLRRYDNYLVFLNKAFRGDYFFLVYTLPDFKFHKKFLKHGYGPEEFTQPNIGFFDEPTPTGAIGYIFEYNLGYYYEINKDFELIRKIKFKEL